MKRRSFISLSASAGAMALVDAHMGLINMGCGQAARNPGQVRITALRLQTIAPLIDLQEFYSRTIGLPAELSKPGELLVRAGKTQITFVHTDDQSNRPFYHFAFNIPENKIQSAFEWQQKRTPVVHPNPAGSNNEIVHFNHWNAHSIFFLDPAGNLVEYIARHDLENAADGDFSVNDILYASEIGLIVDDVSVSGKTLQDTLPISEYRPMTPGFWPIGDESALLLVIEKGKLWRSNPDQQNKTDIFKTAVTFKMNGLNKWTFPGYPYEIISG